MLVHGRWFSPGTLTSSTTKTGRHDMAEILLKVALNTNNQSINQSIPLIVLTPPLQQHVNIKSKCGQKPWLNVKWPVPDEKPFQRDIKTNHRHGILLLIYYYWTHKGCIFHGNLLQARHRNYRYNNSYISDCVIIYSLSTPDYGKTILQVCKHILYLKTSALKNNCLNIWKIWKWKEFYT